MLRIMLVDDTPQQANPLKTILNAAGFSVVAEVRSATDLYAQVARVRPDLIIIDTDSPGRDLLEQICVVERNAPHPIVMFTGDGSSKSIQAAIGAGVSAYIVDGVDPIRIPPILEVALARFEQDQELKSLLADMETRLAERKLIERAKGIIMEKRGAGEAEAYRLLRKMAMDRGQRLAEVARNVIDMSKVFG